jgi:hypothetical protein
MAADASVLNLSVNTWHLLKTFGCLSLLLEEEIYKLEKKLGERW